MLSDYNRSSHGVNLSRNESLELWRTSKQHTLHLRPALLSTYLMWKDRRSSCDDANFLDRLVLYKKDGRAVTSVDWGAERRPYQWPMDRVTSSFVIRWRNIRWPTVLQWTKKKSSREPEKDGLNRRVVVDASPTLGRIRKKKNCPGHLDLSKSPSEITTPDLLDWKEKSGRPSTFLGATPSASHCLPVCKMWTSLKTHSKRSSPVRC